MKEAENRFLDFINQEKLIKNGDKVIAAISGGIDSTVLLNLLVSVKKRINICEIIVAHLNHNLRGEESDRDEAFVKSMAEELELQFVSKSVDIRSLASKGHGAIQEVARNVRLKFLEDCALKFGANRIATGHNRDDLAETTIMWLMRGSGLKGVSGIFPKRGLYIRPMLCLTRADIMQYSAAKGLLHVEDSSNAKLDYARNRIRHELLPLMEKEFYKGAKENISRFAELARNDNEYLDGIASAEVEKRSYKLKDSAGLGIKISDLFELPTAINTRVLRFMISGVSKVGKDISSRHIESIIELCKKDEGGQKFIDLPDGVKVVRSYTNLLIKNILDHPDNFHSEGIYNITNVPGSTNIPELGLNIELSVLPGGNAIERYKFDKKNITFLDFDKVKLPLCVRLPKLGDYFVPLGCAGKKKLSDFFIDSKIPQDVRWHIPLLADRDNVLWVTGYRTSELYRINIQSRNVLMVTVNQL